MANDTLNKIVPIIMSNIAETKESAHAEYKTSVILDIVIILALIDASVIKPEEVIQKIDEARHALPQPFHVPEVDLRLKHVIGLLERHVLPK